MLETTDLAPQKVDPYLTTKIVRSYVKHHTIGAGEVSELITSVHGALLSLDGQISPRKFSLPLCQCGDLYSTTLWSVWIAAIGEKCCYATSVRSMGCEAPAENTRRRSLTPKAKPLCHGCD